MKKNIVIIVLAVLLVIVSVGFGVMYFNTNKDVNVNNEPPIVDNNQHQEENNNQQQTGVTLKNDDIFTYVGTVLVKVNQNVQHVVIPEGVTEIGNYAFGYSNVESVKIPNTVTKIGDEAFYKCGSLKNIQIPNSVKEFGVNCFYDTLWLNEQFYNTSKEMLVINNVLLKLKESEKLKGEYTIPEGIEVIEDYAFYESNITDLNVPLDVFRKNIKVFGNFKNLKTVNGIELAEVLESIDYDYYVFDNKIFYDKYIKKSNKNLKPIVLNLVRHDYFDYIYDEEKGFNEDLDYYNCYVYQVEREFTKEQIEKYKNIPDEVRNFYLKYDMLGAPGDSVFTIKMLKYSATSSLKENGKVYNVENLDMDKQNESWVEGVEGYGIGEKITIDSIYYGYPCGVDRENNDTVYDVAKKLYKEFKNLKPYYYISEVCIENGFCKSKELWEKNSRVKTMKLTFTWKDKSVEYILNLEDTMKPQIFKTGFETTGVDAPIRATFEILDVYKGTTYDDTALTTIDFVGGDVGIPAGY